MGDIELDVWWFVVTVQNAQGHTREIGPIDAPDAKEAGRRALLVVLDNCRRAQWIEGYKATWGLNPNAWSIKSTRVAK